VVDGQSLDIGSVNVSNPAFSSISRGRPDHCVFRGTRRLSSVFPDCPVEVSDCARGFHGDVPECGWFLDQDRAGHIYSLVAPACTSLQGKSLPRIRSANCRTQHSTSRFSAPVFEGTDDVTLNCGVGRVPGTGHPGEGNFSIAGHRDGFFRGLKDIKTGDAIEVLTTTERGVYIVERTEIVTPADVGVVAPRPVAALTLITCYPFYFVGDAPQRFVVAALLKDRESRHPPLDAAPAVRSSGQP